PTKAVTRILARRDGGQHEPRRRGGRKVLGRVHRHVGPPVQHGRLHLGDEDTLPADLPDRHVAQAIAAGVDDDGLDLPPEELADVARLPTGELAAPGGRPQRRRGSAHDASFHRARLPGGPPPTGRTGYGGRLRAAPPEASPPTP